MTGLKKPEITPSGIQKEFSIEINEAQIALMLEHLCLMLQVNENMNLTRITAPEEALDYHIKDSLSIVRHVNQSKQGRFLDLGTGGGYPGIPVGIATGRKGVLLDSTRKKVDAVNGFIEALGLGETLSAVAARAEEYAIGHRGGFSVVVARAVAKAGELIELASPLLCHGGDLIMMKGMPDTGELKYASAVAKLAGMKLISSDTFTLGAQGKERTILVYRKTGKPKVKLPRKVGEAQNKPLR